MFCTQITSDCFIGRENNMLGLIMLFGEDRYDEMQYMKHQHLHRVMKVLTLSECVYSLRICDKI